MTAKENIDHVLHSSKSSTDVNMIRRQQQPQQKTHIVAVEMEAPPVISVHVPQTVLLTDLKKKKAYVQCPHCLQLVYTKVSFGGGVLFFSCFLSSAVVFVLFHMLSMMVIQLVLIFTLQDIIHTCPSCSKRIATYKRLGRVVSINKTESIPAI